MPQLAQLDPDLPEHFVSWADELEARGEARGRALGEARGRAHGELRQARRLLLKLATAKLGPPTKDHASIVNAMPIARLERATLRVLHAHSWDELLG